MTHGAIIIWRKTRAADHPGSENSQGSSGAKRRQVPELERLSGRLPHCDTAAARHRLGYLPQSLARSVRERLSGRSVGDGSLQTCKLWDRIRVRSSCPSRFRAVSTPLDHRRYLSKGIMMLKHVVQLSPAYHRQLCLRLTSSDSY